MYYLVAVMTGVIDFPNKRLLRGPSRRVVLFEFPASFAARAISNSGQTEMTVDDYWYRCGVARWVALLTANELPRKAVEAGFSNATRKKSPNGSRNSLYLLLIVSFY